MISVVVLQNHMDFLKGELGSCSETCEMSTYDGNEVTGIKVERFNDITEEAEQKPTTVPVIKTEPKVSCVCGECMDISCRLYPELPGPISVCPGGGGHIFF